MRSKDLEIVGPSKIPFSTRDPFVFHRLGHLGEGDSGYREMVASRGISLSPAASRPRTSDVGIGELDRSFGDDRFVFFSPCAPVGGEPLLEPEEDRRDWHHKPTVAYRLSDLRRLGRLGWRPHDMIHVYEDFVMFRRDQRERLGVARVTTVWGRRWVDALARLYARFLRSSGDARATGEARAEAEALCAGLKTRQSATHDIDWMAPFLPPSESNTCHDEDAWPDVLGCSPSPEILIAASVPVALAAYHYDSSSRAWRPGPPGG